MSTKTTEKKSNGATSAKSNKTQKVVTNKAGKVTGVTNNGHIENGELQASENATEQPAEVVATVVTPAASKPKAKSEKKVVPIKSASKKVQPTKNATVRERKVKLAASCYHYYRHFLKEFLRPLLPTSRFQKAADSYDGFIVVEESDKARGLKALEKWKKENPDVKDLFWDVKK